MVIFDQLTLPAGLKVDTRSNIRPDRPNVILSSGYGIYGFEDPVQLALIDRLEELDIGWAQYTYAERNSKNRVTDLEISSGTASLLKVYDWVSSQHSSNIGLFGISFGGNVSLEAALQRNPTLVLLINPVFDYFDYRRLQLGPDVMDRWLREHRITMTYDDAKPVSYYRFIEEAETQNLLERVKELQTEIIACQGDADHILGTRYVEEFSRLSPRFSAVPIPGADHIFSSDAAITAFLAVVGERLQEWALVG